MFFGMNNNCGCNKGCANHGVDFQKGCGNDCCLLILILLLCGCGNGFAEDNCCWNIILLLLLMQCICK